MAVRWTFHVHNQHGITFCHQLQGATTRQTAQFLCTSEISDTPSVTGVLPSCAKFLYQTLVQVGIGQLISIVQS